MNKLMNKPAYTITDRSITVIWEGKPYTVVVDNPNYKGLFNALLSEQYDKVPELLSTEKRIETFSRGNIKVQDGKLFYRSIELKGVVVDKLFSLLRAGLKDASPLLNFIEKLMANPSNNSVEQLYTFLSYRELPIKPDGDVIAYKGVEANYYSKHGNKETVVLQGVVDDAGRIRNKVGDVIEVQRRSVDDNKDRHCSHGLHVGSYDYAKGWAGSEGHLMLVSFNPADAVSVPTDCSFQKARVCKYRVESEVPFDRSEPIADPVYSTDDSEVEYEEEAESVLPENNTYRDSTVLAIKNYLDNKFANATCPTLKQIQSRLKGISITVSEIANICKDLGYGVDEDEDAFSNSVVYEQ